MAKQGGWSLNAGELYLGGEDRNIGRVTEYAECDFSFLCFPPPPPKQDTRNALT